jgi:hypothetical protein
VLKEHSAGYKVKRMLAFIWGFITHSALWVMPLVALLLFISLTFYLTGFFNSQFWILSLPLMLCTVVGRSVHYLHQEIEETRTRLHAKQALSVVLKRLKGSILYALIPAILFFNIYYIQQLANSSGTNQSASIVFLEGAVLTFILGGLYFLKGEISWLLHHVTPWRRASKHEQVPPLQQHMHKRP